MPEINILYLIISYIISYIQLTTHHINNRALKPSEFKMNAILDFARFLSSGCFVGDLGFILGGFAVVVCVWGVSYGVLRW